MQLLLRINLVLPFWFRSKQSITEQGPVAAARATAAAAAIPIPLLTIAWSKRAPTTRPWGTVSKLESCNHTKVSYEKSGLRFSLKCIGRDFLSFVQGYSMWSVPTFLILKFLAYLSRVLATTAQYVSNTIKATATSLLPDIYRLLPFLCQFIGKHRRNTPFWKKNSTTHTKLPGDFFAPYKRTKFLSQETRRTRTCLSIACAPSATSAVVSSRWKPFRPFSSTWVWNTGPKICRSFENLPEE